MSAEPASLWRRLGAVLYDGLLVLAVLMLVTIPFVAIRGGEPVAAGDNFGYRLSLFVVMYAFFAGYWTRSGQTLGMQSWGLRVEGPDGQPPDLRSASIRFAVSTGETGFTGGYDDSSAATTPADATEGTARRDGEGIPG